MLISHPFRGKFKVTQYCLEKKDQTGWTNETMRSKRWQLIKHWLSNGWRMQGKKEATERICEGVRMKNDKSREWMGAKEKMTRISCRIELKRSEWSRGWKGSLLKWFNISWSVLKRWTSIATVQGWDGATIAYLCSMNLRIWREIWMKDVY